MNAPALHRFTVADYYRMAETGVIRPDARVELLDGQIIDMLPIGPFHAGCVNRLTRFLTDLSQARWLVSVQNPLRLSEHSELQPDLLLLKPDEDDYTTRHPTPDDVFLLIEAADSTLLFDRTKKLRAYGRAGIPEVWLLNLLDRTIEVYREPTFTGYSSQAVLQAGEKACPLAFPDAAVEVAALLRRAK
jgi:Uma2 family endonuclease